MRSTKSLIVRNIVVVAFIAAIIAFSSCEKYIWDPPVIEPPDTTGGFDTIFYLIEIAPLFPDYSCTSCHGGAIAPDLRPEFSYDQLTTLGLIDATNPGESDVVEKMESETHGAKWSFDHIKLFTDWVYQGAMNN